MKLTDNEKRDIVKFIEEGKNLPDHMTQKSVLALDDLAFDMNFDEVTAQKIRQVNMAKQFCVSQENYEAAKSLKVVEQQLKVIGVQFSILSPEEIRNASVAEISTRETYVNNKMGGTWKQCSYNGSFRKQFAGVGMTYNSELDMFITPKPFPSWTLDSNGDWQPPVARPSDYVPHNRGGNYLWNESGQSWDANPNYTPYTP